MAVVARLAHKLYGAGYSSGAAPLTGDGTQKTYAPTFTNESGADITVASVVFQGWTLRTSGTTDASANYDVTGTVEYPIGGTTTSIGTVTVTPGGNVASGNLTLATPIPSGASFKLNLAATPANGATYISNLGFAGLRNHAENSTLHQAVVAGFGDSIMTNNNGALFNAATNRAGCYLNSIGGTTAGVYGASGAALFDKQASLAALLGCTWVMTNFGTNDYLAGTDLATLQGYVTNLRDKARSYGLKYAHCTMLPRTTSATPVSVTSLTSVGNVMTATVADASVFAVGKPFTFSGAVQAEYNTTKICLGINLGNNTATFHFQGSGTSPATGTITVTSWKATSEVAFQPALTSFYSPGSGSPRGQFNAWVRSGVFDSYVEWADACEPSRDAGRWKIADEDPLLPNIQLVTVSSVISSTRFLSDYNRGSNTFQNGFLAPFTGANIGINRSAGSNTNGDITVASAFGSAQQVGDQYYVVPGVYYMSDDGTHPRVSGGGKGAQPMLDNATASWLDAHNSLSAGGAASGAAIVSIRRRRR